MTAVDALAKAATSAVDKAKAAQQTIARAEAAGCPTLERLLALKPGEEFRYLTEDSLSTSGPACKALIARIKDSARGLVLKGRIEVWMNASMYGHGGNRVTVTEFWARGVERSK